jgi:hypothetical protein
MWANWRIPCVDADGVQFEQTAKHGIGDPRRQNVTTRLSVRISKNNAGISW